MLEEMKKTYVKPETQVIDMDDEVMKNTSTSGKPGHGWGAGGHYGPPGQGYTPEHPLKDDEEYEYESELWD